jgi:hypothetical protein
MMDEAQRYPLKVDPYGLTTGHTWIELGIVLDLINVYHITRFVELGVHVGGFTAVLSPLVLHKPGFRYLAVEINQDIVTKTVQRLPEVSFLWGDCLDPIVRHEIELFIRSTPSMSFIYCDNGNKPKEFEAYAQLLRQHDLIAAHDYGPYEAGAYWLGSAKSEIHAEDVEPVAERWGLERIRYPEPSRITVWRKA